MMHITITLPEGGELLIAPGDRVDFTTEIYKEIAKSSVKIPLSRMFNADGKKVFQALRKFTGDSVHRGELMAEFKSIFSTKRYFSEYDGTVTLIDHKEGTVTLEANTDENLIDFSPFKGEITSIEGTRVTFAVSDFLTFPLGRPGTDLYGGPFYLLTPDSPLISEDEIKDRIVIAEEIKSHDMPKLEALGAIGFVTKVALPETFPVPTALLDSSVNISKIGSHQFPYCIIDEVSSTIYFYDSK